VAGHSFDALTFLSPKGGSGWIDGNRCEWAVVVGDRIRRLRRDRDLTLVQLASSVQKPGGKTFSPGHLSKIERGWANAPLATYLAIATALAVTPWRLLGPEEVQKEVTDAELTLIQFLRHVGLAPHEALARLAGDPAGTASEPPGSRPARAAAP
jgi:transcriptional regulator with XRE-family HTH domain